MPNTTCNPNKQLPNIYQPYEQHQHVSFLKSKRRIEDEVFLLWGKVKLVHICIKLEEYFVIFQELLTSWDLVCLPSDKTFQ